MSYLQSLVHCGNRGTIARYRQYTSENEFSERRCNALRYCAGAIVYRCWISPKQRRPRFSVVHRRFKSMGERSASWLMWSFASYISRAPRYPSFMHPLCSSKWATIFIYEGSKIIFAYHRRIDVDFIQWFFFSFITNHINHQIRTTFS